MPELPEVEVVRLELSLHCKQKTILSTTLSNTRLRYQVDQNLPKLLYKTRILDIVRRGKYLIFILDSGNLMIHLGMSGELSICPADQYQKRKHEHLTLSLNNNVVLSFYDPRKFGAILFSTLTNIQEHKLLKSLGPEPLTKKFHGTYLYKVASKTTKPVKNLLMDNICVTGIGNIYAAEILFESGINPTRLSNTLSHFECNKICNISKNILSDAIKKGGTTIKDFKNLYGKMGYFQQELKVYGRNDLPCPNCNTVIIKTKTNNRSTYSCPNCQK